MRTIKFLFIVLALGLGSCSDENGEIAFAPESIIKDAASNYMRENFISDSQYFCEMTMKGSEIMGEVTDYYVFVVRVTYEEKLCHDGFSQSFTRYSDYYVSADAKVVSKGKFSDVEHLFRIYKKKIK